MSISFALEILLDCETIEKAHKACRKYIKELEKGQVQPQRAIIPSIPPPTHIAPNTQQAPSTQRLLEAQAATNPPQLSKIPAAQQILAAPPGVSINNGDGTIGKRKW